MSGIFRDPRSPCNCCPGGCACGTAKQIVAAWPKPALFTGFSWPSLQVWTNNASFVTAGNVVVGEVQSAPPTGGSWSGSGTFGVGDLVISESQYSEAVLTQGSTSWTAPQTWTLYRCIVAISGSADAPWHDTTHFAGITETEGMTSAGWTGTGLDGIDASYAGSGSYEVLTETNVLAGFASGNGTITRQWTYPTQFAAVGYTGGSYPGDGPAALCWRSVNAANFGIGGASGAISVGYASINWPRFTMLALPTLTATSLEFEFLAGYVKGGGFYDTPSSTSTVTCTIAVSSEYTDTAWYVDCAAIYSTAKFASMPCGTSTTGSYNADGSISYTGTDPVSPLAIVPSCSVGTEIANAVAVNGYPVGMSAAIAVPCAGSYCARTYNCPSVTCAGSAADGSTPVILNPASTPGVVKAIYAGGCS